MLPADADREALIANIGTTRQVVEARRKMDEIKATGEWSNVPFPNKRAFLHNPDFIIDDTEEPPVVLDVTAGGGSIPFEAGRLARIHRGTGMDGVRTAEGGGEGVTGAMIRARIRVDRK